MNDEYVVPFITVFAGFAPFTYLSRSGFESSPFQSAVHDSLEIPNVLSDKNTNHVCGPSVNRIVSRLLTELSNTIQEEEEEGECPPSAVIEGTRLLLSKAIPLVRRSNNLPKPRLLIFQGGIRITWITPNKNVRLVWPGKYGQSPYIYQERVYDAQSFSQEVFSPVDVTTLVRSLNWLNI